MKSIYAVLLISLAASVAFACEEQNLDVTVPKAEFYAGDVKNIESENPILFSIGTVPQNLSPKNLPKAQFQNHMLTVGKYSFFYLNNKWQVYRNENGTLVPKPGLRVQDLTVRRDPVIRVSADGATLKIVSTGTGRKDGSSYPEVMVQFSKTEISVKSRFGRGTYYLREKPVVTYNSHGPANQMNLQDNALSEHYILCAGEAAGPSPIQAPSAK